MPKKGGGGLGQFVDLRGWLGKKEGGGVFEGGLIPQCRLWVQKTYPLSTNDPHCKNQGLAPDGKTFLDTLSWCLAIVLVNVVLIEVVLKCGFCIPGQNG